MGIKTKDKDQFGSDHYIHIHILDLIRKNNFNYRVTKLSCHNEKHTAYPILFHFILARFFYNTAINKPKNILAVLNILSLLSFNLFLFFYQESLNWVYVLKANIIFFAFPFSYIFWNAKNRGLSARGMGLFLGQLFIYFLLFYTSKLNFFYLLPLTVVVFIALLSSQFTFQFILLISFFYGIFKFSLIIFIPILFSILLYYVLFPKVCTDFFYGQINHKINYAKYLAPIYIINRRPNIYRDFFYDFWIKLKSFSLNRVVTLYYIYSNPLLELIYGFPFLWVTFVYISPLEFSSSTPLIENLIYLTLGIFFLISINPLRFLGEPQRYMEFLIPLITIFFLNNTPNNLHWSIIILSILFISFVNYIFRKLSHYSTNNYGTITTYLKNNFDASTILTSNDSNFCKHLIPYFRVVKTDLLKKYNFAEEFNSLHNNDFAIHSVQGLKYFYDQYRVQILIINTDLYQRNDILKLNNQFDLIELHSEAPYHVYKIK